ncbi:MAG: hypothetical protein NVSMB9_18890 [Isosphaeraceae bacterium]
MRRTFASGILSLIASTALSATTHAETWTGPKEVAQSAQEFAGAAETLQNAIKDVDDTSPLVDEVRSLAKSATRLHHSVADGAMYPDAKNDFRKIETSYAHFQAGLKKAHDIHHEKPVADAVKKVKTHFNHLQADMSGRPHDEKTEIGR